MTERRLPRCWFLGLFFCFFEGESYLVCLELMFQLFLSCGVLKLLTLGVGELQQVPSKTRDSLWVLHD